MKVLKFGGKSIATTERLKSVADLVIKRGRNIVIIPAVPDITKQLEDISEYLYRKNLESASMLINGLKKELYKISDSLYETVEAKQSAKEYINSKIDYIRSFTKDLFTLFEERIILAQGELISCRLFYLLLNERNINVCELPALDFMRMDKNSEPDTEHIRKNLLELLEKNNADIYLTEGYITRNTYGEIDDFRKGGNDFSATLVGAAIEAEEIQIWTDVDSMHNIDPHIVKNPETISDLNFDEAAELAYFGDKVLHPSSILPAKLANIPVRILSILSPDSEGTLISENAQTGKIKVVATRDGITAININSGKMLLAHGFLRKIFEIFENYQTPVDMLVSSEVGISITIDNTRNLDLILDNLKKHGMVSVDSDMTLVCIIGDLDWNSNDNKDKAFFAIKGLPIRMVSYGGNSHNLSLLISRKDKEKTLLQLNNILFHNV